MKQLVYEKNKPQADKTLRCWLTLDCQLNCGFCSAGIPGVSGDRRSIAIDPSIWAEGINRRGRPIVLTGGEPFLYKFLPDLLARIKQEIPIAVYTNLLIDPMPILARTARAVSFRVSLHPGASLETWHRNACRIIAAGHRMTVFIIRTGDWETLLDWARQRGYSVHSDSDHRRHLGVYGTLDEPVFCATRVYLYGPDGYRYLCAHDLLRGINQFEHISEPDGSHWLRQQCGDANNCAPCDFLKERRMWRGNP